MSALRVGAAVLVAAAATGGLVALSRAPYVTGEAEADGARLRVSWSGRPERIERCRERSDAELAELPAHMRLRLECEGHPARYVVRVATDGATRSTDTVTGGGLRGDRPIYMLREYALAPGPRAIAVEVVRSDTVGAEGRERDDGEAAEGEAELGHEALLERGGRERNERRRQRQEMLPPLLRIDTLIEAAPGAVVLVTYDPIARRLVAVTGERR